MLRDRGDDWNVNLGVTRVPEGVEAATPWSYDTFVDVVLWSLYVVVVFVYGSYL